MLKLKNGQFKDFTALQVAYEMRFGKDDTSQRIFSASVTAGLFNYSAKAQRSIMYQAKSLWAPVIEQVVA